MADEDEDAVLIEIVDRLREKFPTVDPIRVEQIVNTAFFHFQDARIREFVPVIAEREARTALRAQASSPRAVA